MKMIAMRLKPGDDLKEELEKAAHDHMLSAGFVATCVGSLSKVTLRMAGAAPGNQDIRTFEGVFEIISLVGTLSEAGSHLHLAVSNADGEVVGGHLKAGTIVKTTAELVIGHDQKVTFQRMLDETTGFDELVVS